MSRKIVGIDINAGNITAVLIVTSLKGHWVQDYMQAPIHEPKHEPESIARAVETIAEEMDLSGAVCIASFPGSRVSFRMLRAPFHDKKKIRQILPFELEPLLPAPLENFSIDFYPLKTSGPQGGTDIITAAVEKSILEFYLNLLTSVGIEPEILTVSGQATALVLAAGKTDDRPCVFVDIDRESGTIFFLADQSVSFIRSFIIPPIDQAGLDPLCIQIRRSIAAFQDAHQKNFEPHELVITGAPCDRKEVEKELATRLELPVSCADMLAETTIRLSGEKPISCRAAGFDNAYALALTENLRLDTFNFIKNRLSTGQRLSDYKTALFKTAVLAGMIGILALADRGLETRALEHKSNLLENEIADTFKQTFPDIKKIVDPVHQMQQKIEEIKKNAHISGGPENRIRKIDILNEISLRIPKEMDIEFEKLVIGSDGVTITGNTDTFNSVDDMKSRMEASNIFGQTTIASANIDRSSNRVIFKLKIQL